MLKKLNIILCFWGVAIASFGQTAEEYEANYTKRITQEVINGVYIPFDLEDAFTELNRLSEASGLAKFKNASEEVIRRRLHFGLGRWILVNWGFEDGSRLSHYLRDKGISYPDDMVRVTIVSWHRYLNGKPLQLEDEIAAIEKRIQEEKAKRDAQRTWISSEKKPYKE